MSVGETGMGAPCMGEAWDDRRSGGEAPRPGDWRRWYDRDRARIIHSSAFRRLQTKTQVLGIGGSDFHRTRLTHSLETAQIAQGIVGRLAADPDVPGAARALLPPAIFIEAVALAHDLGHPPFGHGGEAALNRCMLEHGGFEGNAQTLRLVCRLEAHSGRFGLDLARRTLLGLLKYPVAHASLGGDGNSPVKCYFDADQPIVDWLLEPFSHADRRAFTRRAFDSSLVELADDIAYGVHDLEDAIALGLVQMGDVHAVWRVHRAALSGLSGVPAEADIEALFADESARKQAIGLLVNFFIIHIRLSEDDAFEHPYLAWTGCLPDEVAALLEGLIALIRRHVIARPVVQMLEFRGQEIVRRLFETLLSDPARFLPAPWLDRLQEDQDAHRTVCDYVAAMTDEQATRNYELLFAPRGVMSFGVL
jgi:dGTPase